MWFSHHALITHQTVSAALRSPALALPPRDDVMMGAAHAASAQTQQLSLVLLQGALLLALCTVVHKVPATTVVPQA